ncbi:hypothetical protein AUC43_17975 [Hymenobacter sedentarius]|uniref:Uncharacterized protein n=1 Tax=Hymenobacter sedentarius TaxID=1411621 RepID=A0A0U3T1M3_9BACT|nr:DUF4113 domain-containing protein [Hymenobacter sedentarius]ALW86803.1 hypothetical protein AUC43_17975 [Hymenobacter sedentarius]
MLSEALATFTAKAAEKLRRHGLAAHLVTVILGTNRSAATAEPTTHTAVISLPHAGHDVTMLTQAALRGLHRLRRPGVAYHRAGILFTGILFSGLEPAGQAQLGLFSSTAADQQRRQQLMATLDALNARFGQQLVRLAEASPAKNLDGQLNEPASNGPRGAQQLYTTGWAEALAAALSYLTT